MQVKEAAAAYSFLWSPKKPSPEEGESGRWSRKELVEFVDGFDKNGRAEEPWQCSAYAAKQIKHGDRAYLLQSGKQRGILGRGQVEGEPEKSGKTWQVKIQFRRERGDVLWKPDVHLPVDKEIIPRQSGWPLSSDDICKFDSIIAEFTRLNGNSGTQLYEDALDEESQENIARLKKLMEQWTRPDQQEFRKQMLASYKGTCAVTKCVTSAALQAAHICAQKGADDNRPSNGILLRSDIHALFDAFLITLSEDGTRMEVSRELEDDQSYKFLQAAYVTRPDHTPPSLENVLEHRKRFLERQK